MIFPSFDHLIVWIIWLTSSFSNIAESVRNCHDSIQTLKKSFVDQGDYPGLLSRQKAASPVSIRQTATFNHHDLAKSSGQYHLDSQWWDEWLNQSGNPEKKKHKLTSSLTQNIELDSNKSEKSPFKNAGFARTKKENTKGESLAEGRIIRNWSFRATSWFVTTTKSLTESAGKVASPWIRTMEFEEIESRTYPEFFLHELRVKSNRIRWQQGVRKLTEFTFELIPLTKEVQQGIELISGFKNRWIKNCRWISEVILPMD